MTKTSAMPSRQRARSWLWTLASAFMVLFVAGGVYCGYLFYSTVKDFVAHAQLGTMPSQQSVEQGRAPEEQLPDLTSEPINILLLGTDRRTGETGPCRTDTMIVLTVDPKNKTAAMLSIPRDLWVPISGHSENRINTAHFLGDRDKYPGGGPALAKQTVQYTLGVPIHYYVLINFEGFEKAIDLIGGVVVNVEEPIRDTKFPDDSYGYITVDIPAGTQQMDGKTALQYARVRHGSSDFSRARRQQQVLKAVRDKVLSLNIPLTRIPEMLKVVGDSVQTDLSLSELYALAKVAREIPMDQISSAVIDESLTTPQTTPDGAQVLLPDREGIRELVDELFGGPTPTGTAALSEQHKVAQEAARLEVQNGTLTPGLAQRTAQELKDLGFNVTAFSNADRSDYAQTVIIDYGGTPGTVAALAERFAVSGDNIRQQPGVQSDLDVRLILGRDYAAAPAQ